jgi:hypothetical protein
LSLCLANRPTVHEWRPHRVQSAQGQSMAASALCLDRIHGGSSLANAAFHPSVQILIANLARSQVDAHCGRAARRYADGTAGLKEDRYGEDQGTVG